MISLIVACDLNGGIGKDNKLLWKLPNDMKHFREVTMGKVVVMGRKTYESIGKPLAGRTNIILTRDEDYLKDQEPENTYVYNSFEDLLCEIETHAKDEEVFIIGGAEIYNLFLPIAERIYVTNVIAEFEVDTYMPEVDTVYWKLLSAVYCEADENNPYDHVIALHERKGWY